MPQLSHYLGPRWRQASELVFGQMHSRQLRIYHEEKIQPSTLDELTNTETSNIAGLR